MFFVCTYIFYNNKVEICEIELTYPQIIMYTYYNIVLNLKRLSVYVFSDSVLALGNRKWKKL